MPLPMTATEHAAKVPKQIAKTALLALTGLRDSLLGDSHLTAAVRRLDEIEQLLGLLLADLDSPTETPTMTKTDTTCRTCKGTKRAPNPSWWRSKVYDLVRPCLDCTKPVSS